jgi:hypothetical protein
MTLSEAERRRGEEEKKKGSRGGEGGKRKGGLRETQTEGARLSLSLSGGNLERKEPPTQYLDI